MPILPAAIAGALALAALVSWLVRRERRLARQRLELLSSMGFRPVARPDPAHGEALLALSRRGSYRDRRLELLRVFHRNPLGGGHLYVFDVYAHAGKRSGLVARTAVALVRAGAQLPFFEAYSETELGGPGFSFAGPLAHGLGRGPEVRFDDAPARGPALIVISTSEGGEGAVRRALTPEVREKLGAARFAVLAAGGDALALQGNPCSVTNRGDWAGLLRRLVEDAPRLAEVLGSSECE